MWTKNRDTFREIGKYEDRESRRVRLPTSLTVIILVDKLFSIKKKLKDLGYGEALLSKNFSRQFDKHSDVKNPRPLTERSMLPLHRPYYFLN